MKILPASRSMDVRKRILYSLRALMIFFVLLALSRSVTAGEAKIPVAVSIIPQAYFVERLGGNRVDVKVMIPKGASPEIYEPTAQQMIALSRARIYVRVGQEDFPAESKYGRILADSRAPVAIVGFPKKSGRIEDDPHIWLSPAAVKGLCAEISKTLISLEPRNRSYFTDNYHLLLQDIEKMEGEIRNILAGKEGKSFLVYHPGWGYFAAAFGLRQLAIEEEGKPVTAAHIKKIVAVAREKGIDVIFVQKGFDTRAARSVAKEIRGDLIEVDNLEKDWINNLIKFALTLKGALR